MRRIEKNRKGFTLAEEVVTVLLIGILVASASAILLNAMRIFCQNVIMFNAQSKGIAVMEQLEDRLNYAKEIGGSYGGISDISRKADCAHQVLLSVKDDDDGKKELVEDGYLYYSDAEDSKNEIRNVLCKLGNYDAEIDLKSGSGNTAVLTVRIKRNDTVYYSEERTVALKNSSVTVITAADSSHVYSNTGTSTYLYIGSLE